MRMCKANRVKAGQQSTRAWPAYRTELTQHSLGQKWEHLSLSVFQGEPTLVRDRINPHGRHGQYAVQEWWLQLALPGAGRRKCHFPASSVHMFLLFLLMFSCKIYVIVLTWCSGPWKHNRASSLVHSMCTTQTWVWMWLPRPILLQEFT